MLCVCVYDGESAWVSEHHDGVKYNTVAGAKKSGLVIIHYIYNMLFEQQHSIIITRK